MNTVTIIAVSLISVLVLAGLVKARVASTTYKRNIAAEIAEAEERLKDLCECGRMRGHDIHTTQLGGHVFSPSNLSPD